MQKWQRIQTQAEVLVQSSGSNAKNIVLNILFVQNMSSTPTWLNAQFGHGFWKFSLFTLRAHLKHYTLTHIWVNQAHHIFAPFFTKAFRLVSICLLNENPIWFELGVPCLQAQNIKVRLLKRSDKNPRVVASGNARGLFHSNSTSETLDIDSYLGQPALSHFCSIFHRRP